MVRPRTTPLRSTVPSFQYPNLLASPSAASASLPSQASPVFVGRLPGQTDAGCRGPRPKRPMDLTSVGLVLFTTKKSAAKRLGTERPDRDSGFGPGHTRLHDVQFRLARRRSIPWPTPQRLRNAGCACRVAWSPRRAGARHLCREDAGGADRDGLATHGCGMGFQWKGVG